MTLWVVLAGMTGFAALFALWPLAFRGEREAETTSEAAFYKAQLGEIERDVERGQLPAEEAAGARAEAARRLLAASAGSAATTPREALALRRAAAALILIAVPLVGLGLYAHLGSPGMPDQPLAGRQADVRTAQGLEAAVARIEAHLAASPDDAKGWSVIAPVYLRLARFDDAAHAFQQVLRLKGEDAATRAGYGEALVGAAGGIVTADAREVFDKALGEEPGLPAARFYLALAAEQEGDKGKAVAMYQALLMGAPKEATWAAAVSARLAALQSGAPGEAPAAAAAAERPAAASGGTASANAGQAAMIQGMVDRLATRLAQGGGDAGEWTRLIRSYAVLRQTDKARDALAAARKALESDPAGARDLDALAHELGIEG